MYKVYFNHETLHYEVVQVEAQEESTTYPFVFDTIYRAHWCAKSLQDIYEFTNFLYEDEKDEIEKN